MCHNEEIQQTQVKENGDMDRVVVKPLSPTEDLHKDGDYGVYKEFLKKAFKTKKISNIAVTGNFGIGKSSVLRTFSKGEEKKFLYLSLLEFRQNGGIEEYEQLSLWDTDNQEEQTMYSLQQFECALLRQLIAKCHKKDIPLSCFQKVQEKNITKYRRIYAFAAGLYILMITALIFKEQISDFFHLFLKDTNLHGIYLILFALVQG